ncbi:VWA domain-containing protein [Adhaeribacter terreus]|uniref:VWA domain-containing protein n=1 Tax=Adhaeribacter terreus TaxID=529703 RepID=A0ABW0EC13_9BACT
MEQFRILLTHSAWFLPLCLLVGAAYAWLLYSKNPPWGKKLNYSLAALRFVVVSFLCFLLLGPVMRYFSNTEEKPAIVFAIDNSESVKLFTDSVALRQTRTGLVNISKKLAENGIETAVKSLDAAQTSDLNGINFDQKSTNLDALLNNVAETYENRNLAAVVLLSDGIVNQGKSPAYSDFQFKLFPVALGDTVPKRDLSLPALQYNKVAFSGNKFPIVAEVRNDGFVSGNATVLLKENGKVLDRKTVALQKNKTSQLVAFSITAPQPGKKHYEVLVESLPGEFTKLNNTKHAYLEVVKGKLKVLLAAAAPHPDIKALKSAIETDENFEVELYLPGIYPLKTAVYDLAILHQLPSRLRTGSEVLQLIQKQKIPAFYILGAQSDLAEFNKQQSGVFVAPRGNQTDEVVPVININFTRFGFAEKASETFATYPPLTVPFADFRLNPAAEVVLQQQVGRLKTTRPLLTIQTGGDNTNGVLVGEGLWQWRLNEAVANDKPAHFDKLITDLVQLLTTKQNKKRLNVYPVQDEFLVSEDVRFQSEVYNSIYEKIYGQQITLTITDEQKKSRTFNFVNGENFSGLNIGNLPGGVYKYTAATTLEGKRVQDSGEFLVQDLALETITSLANHNLLYQLARKNGNKLYYPNQLAQLEKDLLEADFKNIIYTEESLKDLINLKWLFFVILALVTAEWFLRKYYGSI